MSPTYGRWGPSEVYDPIRVHTLHQRPSQPSKNGKDRHSIPPMFTPDDFRAWMQRHSLSISGAMRLLRVKSRETIRKYKYEEVPHVVALACRCIDLERKKTIISPVTGKQP